jgi:hypothetical protein
MFGARRVWCPTSLVPDEFGARRVWCPTSLVPDEFDARQVRLPDKWSGCPTSSVWVEYRRSGVNDGAKSWLRCHRHCWTLTKQCQHRCWDCLSGVNDTAEFWLCMSRWRCSMNKPDSKVSWDRPFKLVIRASPILFKDWFLAWEK